MEQRTDNIAFPLSGLFCGSEYPRRENYYYAEHVTSSASWIKSLYDLLSLFFTVDPDQRNRTIFLFFKLFLAILF